MRKVLLLVLILSTIMAVVGVSAQEDDLSGVDPSGVTITYWHQYNNDPQLSTMNALVEKFNAENEWGITVEASAQGNYGELRELMNAAIISGELPNLVAGYANDAISYYLDDAALDLTPYMNSAEWGFSEEDTADFNEGILAINNVDVDGETAMLAWPNQISAPVLAVNLDMLSSLGFEGAPTDFETFMEVACAAANSGGDVRGYPIKFDSSNFESMVASRGGSIWQDGQYSFTNDAVIETLQFYKDLYDSGCAYIPESQFGNTDDFALGINPMALGSSAGIPFILSGMEEAGQTFNWTVATTPYTEGNQTLQVFVPSIIVVPSTPEENLASWLFLQFLALPENQETWTAATGYFPTRRSVAARAGEFMDASNPVYPYWQTVNELLNNPDVNIYFSPQNLTYGALRDLVSAAMADVTTNGRDVAEVAAELEEEANALLEE